jgi:hypothetical protein
LDVVTPCIVDAVTFIGGWIFDHATNGWDVRVLTSDHRDIRPLQILGAAVEQRSQLGNPTNLGANDTSVVAVATSTFATDPRAGAKSLATLAASANRTLLWGLPRPADAELSMAATTYDLSTAAVAFKRHALQAAHAPTDTVHRPEMLYTAGDAGL